MTVFKERLIKKIMSTEFSSYEVENLNQLLESVQSAETYSLPVT